MKKILLLALGFTLCMEAGPNGLSHAASDQPKQGGTLTMAIRRDLLLANPFVNVRSTQGRIMDLLYDPLLGLDDKGKLRPSLAESWEVSKDGKTLTFKLRKGVKFHNGQEMNSEDVKFSINYSRNPKNGAQGFPELAPVENVEAPDRYTFKIFLKAPSPAFLYSLTALRVFPIVPKGSVPEGVDTVPSFPPGTGPFKLVEWKRQQHVILERYADFWGPKVYLDRLVMKPIREDTVRLTALRAGDVDFVERAPLEWIKQIADGKLKGIRYAPAKYAEFEGIEFNVAVPPFNNKKLRLAVAHAINKKEIFDAAFMGFGELSDQKYPKGHDWYFEGLPAPSYDLEKARALLKEAGYRGEEIEFLSQSSFLEQAGAAAVQAQLKRVGMNVRIRPVDEGDYRSRPRKGDFSFRFDGGTLYPDPLMAYGELHCEPDLNKRAQNTAGYCDKQMDAWIDKAEKDEDPQERRAIVRNLVAKALEDIPEIYLGYVPQFYALGDHVKGFTTDSDANFRWWGGGLTHAWIDK